MILDYAFLARAAEFTSEGRLSVLGGDYNTVLCDSFPYAIPVLALVLKFKGKADEANVDHQLSIEFVQEEEVTSLRQMKFQLEHRGESPLAQANFGVVFNMIGLQIVHPGVSKFIVKVDDTICREVELIGSSNAPDVTENPASVTEVDFSEGVRLRKARKARIRALIKKSPPDPVWFEPADDNCPF